MVLLVLFSLMAVVGHWNVENLEEKHHIEIHIQTKVRGIFEKGIQSPHIYTVLKLIKVLVLKKKKVRTQSILSQ